MLLFAKIFYFIFGALSIAGGIVGYLKKRSLASLIAGDLCGTLLIVAGFLLPGQKNLGLIIGLIVSVALAGKFLPDYLHKKAVMPGGLMAALSLAGVAVTLFAWYK